MPPLIDTPFKFGVTAFVATLCVVVITFGNIFLGIGLALVFGFGGYAFWAIYLKAPDHDKKGYFSKMSGEGGGEEAEGSEDKDASRF